MSQSSWLFAHVVQDCLAKGGGKHKVSNAPPGYSAIPGSHAGGYRKRQGNKWVYWYPDLGHAAAGEAKALGDEASESTIKRMLDDGLRKLSNPDHVAERVWEGIKETAHEFPVALGALGKLARGQRPTKHESLALVSTTAMIGSAALVGAKYGSGAGAATLATKFAIHVAMAALHTHANTAYTGVGGGQFAEKIWEYGPYLLHALKRPEPPEVDEAEALDFIRTIARGMRDELKSIDAGELASKLNRKTKAKKGNMLFSDILKASGGERAGHKYRSRKPSGNPKRPWVYDYGDGKGYVQEKKAEAPFSVGETLQLTAPDGLSVGLVNYRGKMGDQATVVLNGSQFTIPLSRLSRPESSKPKPEPEPLSGYARIIPAEIEDEYETAGPERQTAIEKQALTTLASVPDGMLREERNLSTEIAMALKAKGLIEFDYEFGDDQPPMSVTAKGRKSLRTIRRKAKAKAPKSRGELMQEYREAIENSKSMTAKEKAAAIKRTTSPGFDPGAALGAMGEDEDEDETQKGIMLFSDIIKASGGERAGHKYRSRKPSGNPKRPWLYDYGDGKGYVQEKKAEKKPERHKVTGQEDLPEGVRERIEKYNLDVIPDGVDDEVAKRVATLLEEGIDKAADLCKQNPPVCAGNMGIPRKDMPQIMDEPIKDMLKSDKELDRKKAEAAVAAGADPTSDKSPFDMMIDHLRDSGVKIGKPEPMSVGKLKATQRDIQAKKATGMAEAAMNDKVPWSPNKAPIVISNDNHILDGHHRWAAMAMLGDKGQMNVIRVDLPMAELLDRSFETPGAGVFRMNLQNEVVEGGKPDYQKYKAEADAKLAAEAGKAEKALPSYVSLLKAEYGEDEDEDEDEDGPDEAEEEAEEAAKGFHHVWTTYRTLNK